MKKFSFFSGLILFFLGFSAFLGVSNSFAWNNTHEDCVSAGYTNISKGREICYKEFSNNLYVLSKKRSFEKDRCTGSSFSAGVNLKCPDNYTIYESGGHNSDSKLTKNITCLPGYTIDSTKSSILFRLNSSSPKGDNHRTNGKIIVFERNESKADAWVNNIFYDNSYYSDMPSLGRSATIACKDEDSGGFKGECSINAKITCKKEYTYSWETGTYGTCNTTCGTGTQTRTVRCKRNDGTYVNDSYCSGSKPSTSQSCTAGSNTCGWSSWGSWSNNGSCNTSTGKQPQTRTRTCSTGNAGSSYCSGSANEYRNLANQCNNNCSAGTYTNTNGE